MIVLKDIGNSNKTKYVFYITLEKLMNTIDYHEFVRLMHKSYSELQSIDVVFSLKNKRELDIREYYKYFINFSLGIRCIFYSGGI